MNRLDSASSIRRQGSDASNVEMAGLTARSHADALHTNWSEPKFGGLPVVNRSSASAAHRDLGVVARATNGQPRSYRLAPTPAQNAAYRRLAVSILGLDVASLAGELRALRPMAKSA